MGNNRFGPIYTCASAFSKPTRDASFESHLNSLKHLGKDSMRNMNAKKTHRSRREHTGSLNKEGSLANSHFGLCGKAVKARFMFPPLVCKMAMCL
jgi:hypothetical protein